MTNLRTKSQQYRLYENQYQTEKFLVFNSSHPSADCSRHSNVPFYSQCQLYLSQNIKGFYVIYFCSGNRSFIFWALGHDEFLINFFNRFSLIVYVMVIILVTKGREGFIHTIRCKDNNYYLSLFIVNVIC